MKDGRWGMGPVSAKYVMVIPDGCADEPQESLGGKTPLEAARKPAMDEIARRGCVGLTNNVPESLTPASDVAMLSLFGYDPLVYYTGRAPLEAAAMGLKLGPEDWAIRCNLVTVEDGKMADFTAGHITSGEGRQLIEAVGRALGTGRLEFHAGVSYRNILVYRGEEKPAFSEKTVTQPPHDIPDQPIAGHLPRGPGGELLCELMERSRGVLAEHAVNGARRREGKRAATQIWLWGQGKAPSLPPFEKVYGKRGAIISAVDLVRGVGVIVGWKRIDVPTATGYLDTDYAAKGRAGVKAIEQADIVAVHVEATDEASHEGRADAKVAALEEIDRHIVGPLLEAVRKYPEHRILVSPDHRTPIRTRAHSHGHVPFAMAGTGVASDGQRSYDEATGAEGRLKFDRGHELMRYFLGGAANS